MKNTSPYLVRRAYVIQGSPTFIGVFGSGLAARCRIVTIHDNYMSCEVLTVAACRERFATEYQMGRVREIEGHHFTNAETEASRKLLELFQVQYTMNLAEPERKEALIIPLTFLDGKTGSNEETLFPAA